MSGRRSRRGARVRAFLRQLAWALGTLWVISLVTFFAMNAGRSPDGLARQALGPHSAPAQRAEYIKTYSLDDPVLTRYGEWLGDFVRGDWGFSFINRRDVRTDILPRMARTLTLALLALLIALPLSLATGLYMAQRWGSAREAGASFVVITLNALPEFVTGLGLLVVFAVALDVLPPTSAGLAFGNTADQIRAWILPVATLVVASAPYMIRVTRAAVREALAAPYARAAVLRGLSRRTVLWDHIMRNAGVSIVNAVAINLVYLIGGVIVVENVFAFPGIGQALIQAIGHGDVITVQAIAVLMGAMFVAISLVADAFVIYLNPRLKAASA